MFTCLNGTLKSCFYTSTSSRVWLLREFKPWICLFHLTLHLFIPSIAGDGGVYISQLCVNEQCCFSRHSSSSHERDDFSHRSVELMVSVTIWASVWMMLVSAGLRGSNLQPDHTLRQSFWRRKQEWQFLLMANAFLLQQESVQEKQWLKLQEKQQLLSDFILISSQLLIPLEIAAEQQPLISVILSLFYDNFIIGLCITNTCEFSPRGFYNVKQKIKD